MKLTKTILTFVTLASFTTFADSECVKIIDALGTAWTKDEIANNYCKNTRGDCIKFVLSLKNNDLDTLAVAKNVCSSGASASCIADIKQNTPFAVGYISQSLCANPTGGQDVAEAPPERRKAIPRSAASLGGMRGN
ncbi:MAG: hypothetical protein H7256_03720 [Bdellovibrio sp.]|nr:hypothetical protein [Bdellovibrio sp.]